MSRPQPEPGVGSVLDAAVAHLDARGDTPCVWYNDMPVSGTEIQRRVTATARAMAEAGVRPGDRVAVMLQNSPEFVVAVLSTWHLGAIVVTVNPMLKQRELRRQIDDCTPRLLFCLESALRDVCQPALAGSSVLALLAAPDPYARDDMAAHQKAAATEIPVTRMESIELRVGDDGPARVSVAADEVAVLIYTSGTTGTSKGAMLTHRNLLSTARAFNQVVHLNGGSRILGLAPMFHVTGFMLHLVLSFVTTADLLLMFRFDPVRARRLIVERRPTFTIAAITAYTALLEDLRDSRAGLSSFASMYTGGAPVSEATVASWQRVTGQYVHNAYGLTECSAPCVAVPAGETAPVDVEHGALSIGKALPGMTVGVRREDGNPAAAGELGEIVVNSPGIMAGYWGNPEETALAIGTDGFLATGDVGFIDDHGWVYLVDRKKDLIIASGYKIWPRDVEDVLYLHPGVQEAAVVGVPDEYRGETVRAYVSARRGVVLDPDEIIEFCRSQLAAYKRPREVVIVDALPKTQSGKILRRSLRSD